jgi:hypothetical protein
LCGYRRGSERDFNLDTFKSALAELHELTRPDATRAEDVVDERIESFSFERTVQIRTVAKKVVKLIEHWSLSQRRIEGQRWAVEVYDLTEKLIKAIPLHDAETLTEAHLALGHEVWEGQISHIVIKQNRRTK